VRKKPSGFGRAIRGARERAGLTPKQVAALVGKDVMTVYRWEWGKREPSFSDLELMANAFGVTPGQLLDGGAA
jgi:transcriptional regulator with XRE-family HTH domain